MERPSHLNVRMPHQASSRVLLSGAAISLPLVLLWGLAHDMVGQTITIIDHTLHVRVEDKTVQPRTPPPVTQMQKIEVLKAVPPIITIAPPASNEGKVTPTPQQPAIPAQPNVTPVSVPDHAPVAIAATHTIPDYPVLLRRQGIEGKVTLGLHVQADGTVGKADVVASSGNAQLDETAQSWVVAHWRYRPATDKGQAVAGSASATIVFRLADQR
jgi:protein TonB